MNIIVRWCRRLVVLPAAVAGLLIPAAAWAQASPVTGATGAPLAKGKAVAAIGGLSALCCLVVVAIIAGAIVMIVRRRRR
jgi:hypothetical protein